MPIDLKLPGYPVEIGFAGGFEDLYFRRLAQLVGPLIDDRQQAHRHIEVAQDKQKTRHDGKIQERKYAIGEKVLLRNFRAKKLDQKWQGPFYIHDIGMNGTYKLRNINGKVRKKMVHADQICPYCERADD